MMQSNPLLVWAPALEDAIDRHPLTVLPTTLLVDVIALIGQTHSHTCSLLNDLEGSNHSTKEVRASCVLVMQGSELLGILTERDVVRLTALTVNFAETIVADVMIHPVITLPQKSIRDVFAALFLFRRYRIRHLPIVDEQDRLVGVISHESIRQILRPANLLRFRRVADVMTTQVVHASLTTTVLQLAQLMAKHRVSCIVITQRNAEGNEQPVGIVTERDIVQFQTLQIDLLKTQAQMVMSTPLLLLSPEDSLWTAHQEMQKRRVGRFVVSWNWGQGLGIVTQTSLLRVFDPMEMYGVIESLQQTIQQLEAEGSLSNPLQAQSSSRDVILLDTDFPLSNKIESDLQLLFTLLENAHKNVARMLVDVDLSVDKRRFLLQSVLEMLEQLDRKIRS